MYVRVYENLFERSEDFERKIDTLCVLRILLALET